MTNSNNVNVTAIQGESKGNLKIAILKQEAIKERAETALKVIKCIVSGERTYIDDHDGSENVLVGYAVLDNLDVCPLFENTYFSLNGLYIDSEDGKIHLSRQSIGGVVKAHARPLNDAIKIFNDEARNNTFMRVKQITDFTIFPNREARL